jgi:hypothetical protein
MVSSNTYILQHWSVAKPDVRTISFNSLFSLCKYSAVVHVYYPTSWAFEMLSLAFGLLSVLLSLNMVSLLAYILNVSK